MRGGWVDVFDPAYSPYTYEVARWQRYAHEPPLVSRNALCIALASVVLLGFIAADVGAATSLPVKVTITQVNWFVGNLSVGNESGFTVLGGHTFDLKLVCEIFCPYFSGLSVANPFTLVNVTVAYPWFEYVNATVQAPNHAYDGPLDATLIVTT